MSLATVSAKGWVVIPKAYRQKYKLKRGTKVRIIDYGSGMSIVPIPQDPIQALRGIFADGPSLIDDLLVEKQKEKEREENKIAGNIHPR